MFSKAFKFENGIVGLTASRSPPARRRLPTPANGDD
jgi:hypothetical protein